MLLSRDWIIHSLFLTFSLFYLGWHLRICENLMAWVSPSHVGALSHWKDVHHTNVDYKSKSYSTSKWRDMIVSCTSLKVKATSPHKGYRWRQQQQAQDWLHQGDKRTTKNSNNNHNSNSDDNNTNNPSRPIWNYTQIPRCKTAACSKVCYCATNFVLSPTDPVLQERSKTLTKYDKYIYIYKSMYTFRIHVSTSKNIHMQSISRNTLYM